MDTYELRHKIDSLKRQVESADIDAEGFTVHQLTVLAIQMSLVDELKTFNRNFEKVSDILSSIDRNLGRIKL